VKRHEVLRTGFVFTDGELKQEIFAEGRLSLRVIDLTGQERVEREARLVLEKTQEQHGTFNLRVGPLIRAKLLRLRPEESVLLITMHHIVTDGWSMGVLLREITQLYSAYREGRDNPLSPLLIQYADYAEWQRQSLPRVDMERQLLYWRTHLEGAVGELVLPTDRPRPELQSYRGKNVPVVLDAHLSARLRAIARQRGMTLFMVLYSAWAILLSRLSGQDEVTIGTPIANRQRPELEVLIGFFVNTLALRVRVQGDLRVDQFLDRVKKMTLEAYGHQDVPFEKIVESVQPERSLNRNPLFQVMLTCRTRRRLSCYYLA